jgi:hypothetical protein
LEQTLTGEDHQVLGEGLEEGVSVGARRDFQSLGDLFVAHLFLNGEDEDGSEGKGEIGDGAFGGFGEGSGFDPSGQVLSIRHFGVESVLGFGLSKLVQD